MSTQPHQHPITASPSILRLSVWRRLGAAALVVALLWGAVLWAMH
jgi:hypothetical protein